MKTNKHHHHHDEDESAIFKQKSLNAIKRKKQIKGCLAIALIALALLLAAVVVYAYVFDNPS